MADRRTTLADVASLAGVSLSVASKALNGGGRMTDATRQRVQDVAHRIGFRPNALARSLARGESLTIGLLVEKAERVFTMPVVIGATTALGARDMAGLVYDASPGARARTEIIAKLDSRRVDGVLVIGDGARRPYSSLAGLVDAPVVYAFGESDDAGDVSFMPDSRGAGRLVAEHLIGIGRTRVAHITSTNDAAAEQRSAGLREALAEAGLPLALGAPLEGDWTQRWGMTAAESILDRLADVDAIFCGNDQIAYGVYRVLQRNGVRVPDDVALVGYDHMSRLIDNAYPFITTVDPNLRALGEAAVDELLRARVDPPEPGVRYLPCTLVEGVSTLGAGAFGEDRDAAPVEAGDLAPLA